MSDETTPGAPSDWKKQIKQLGKAEFERREMERLGFWPPSEEELARYAREMAEELARHATEIAEMERLRAQIPRISEELRAVTDAAVPLRSRRAEIDSEIVAAGTIQEAITQARRERIERVRQERAERRVQKAQHKAEKLTTDRQWRAQNLPFLGRGVSAGLRFETPSDTTRLTLHSLPALDTANDVAAWLGMPSGQLAWLCYHREAAPLDHYRHFTIPKKSGGLRAISAPRPHLKRAQETILRTLLDLVPVHVAAMAFRPALHIGHNAVRHCHPESGGPALLLKIDLKDFFPSISFKRVKGVFQSLGYNEGVSTLLGLLCTEAPRVEAEFEGLARSYGFLYTRYADDLIFSSPNPKAQVMSLRDGARMIIEAEKLVVNEEKVSIARRGGRQSVTGLVINALNSDGAPRPSRRDLRHFRAFLHGYETRGREALTLEKGQDALAYARGYLAFIHMTAPDLAIKLRAAHGWLNQETP